MNGLHEIMMQFPGVLNVIVHDDSLAIECDANITTVDINKYCFQKNIILSQLSLKRKSLEKRFLEITGGKSDR